MTSTASIRPRGSTATLPSGNGTRAGSAPTATVVCWGEASFEIEGRFSAISGDRRWCGLRTDGSIACWLFDFSDDGSRLFFSSERPGPYSTVSVGGDNECGLRADGTVVCWDGYNVRRIEEPEGVIWHDPTVDGAQGPDIAADAAEAVSSEDRFSAVAAGDEYSCALRTDGTVTCWGWNFHGQVVAPEGRFVAVTAGWTHSCALRSDNTAVCWGDEEDGKTRPPNARFSTITSGDDHSCGLRLDGTVGCWGDTYWAGEPPHGEFTRHRRRRECHVCGTNRRQPRVLGRRPRLSHRG